MTKEVKQEQDEPVCRMRIGQDSVTWYDEKGNVTMRVDSSNKVTTKPQVKQEQGEPITWECVLSAVARGWCYEENFNKTMDFELAVAIAEEVHALYTTQMKKSKQEQSEPVAYFNPQKGGFYWAKPTKIEAPITVDVEPLPLYTAPPNLRERAEGLQRDYDLLFAEYKALKQEQGEPKEWLGLTDEEIYEIYEATEKLVGEHWDNGGTILMFPTTLYQAIEAKLKEKNA
jgi:hypothetical protein